MSIAIKRDSGENQTLHVLAHNSCSRNGSQSHDLWHECQKQEAKGCSGQRAPQSLEGYALGKASLHWPRQGAHLASGGFWLLPAGPPSRPPCLLLAWSPKSIKGFLQSLGHGLPHFPYNPESYSSSKSAQDALRKPAVPALDTADVAAYCCPKYR